MNTFDILSDILAERVRQNKKWGEQNHPDVDPTLMNRPGGCTPERMAENYEIPSAARAKFICQNENEPDTWAAILIEEVAESVEAATIGTVEELHEELIQVAAVCVQWIECLQRNGRLV